MTNTTLPTVAEFQKGKLHLGNLRDIVSGSSSVTTPEGTEHKSVAQHLNEMDAKYNAAIGQAGYQVIGTWTAGTTKFEAYDQVAYYNGFPYQPKGTTPLPYTAQGDDPTSSPDLENVFVRSEKSIFTFSSVEQLKIGQGINGLVITASLIDYADRKAETLGYHGSYDSGFVPRGSGKYVLTTLQRVRDAKSDQSWVPDGVIDHYLYEGNTYVAMLNANGFISVECAGSKGTDSTYDIPAVNAANEYGETNRIPVKFTLPRYYLGTSSHTVNCYYTNWFSDGDCDLIFSGSSGDYAINLVGTDSYEGTERLAKSFLKNFNMIGGAKTSLYDGAGLRLSGGTSSTRLSVGSIDYVSIRGWKTTLDFQDYCWKLHFNNCRIMWGVIKTPTSTYDFGEDMIFTNCFIADMANVMSSFNRGEWKFIGTSFDNAPFDLYGDTIVRIIGGHLENPLNTLVTYRYAAAYEQASLKITDTWITTNNRAFEQPIFLCDTTDGKDSGISFDGCVWGYTGNYAVQSSGDFLHDYIVEGSGKVSSRNWTFLNYQDYLVCPISEFNNEIYNGNFELGSDAGWAVREIGSGSQLGTYVATVTTTSPHSGTYCGRFTATWTGGSTYGIEIYHKLDIKPGDIVAGGLYLRNSWDASLNGSLFQVFLNYYSSNGTLIQENVLENYKYAQVSSWKYRRVGNIAPKGAAIVEVVVQILGNADQPVCTGYIDDFHLSIIKGN
jgi:hypothetical protein